MGAPVFPVAAIDDPAVPEALAELAAARADEMDADTVNRELSIARKAIGIGRRSPPPDRIKAPRRTRSPHCGALTSGSGRRRSGSSSTQAPRGQMRCCV